MLFVKEQLLYQGYQRVKLLTLYSFAILISFSFAKGIQTLDISVAFIIFNRPDLTHRVFAAIAEAKPKRLLVVADGPRFPEESEKCRQARAVIEKVNWDCEVLTNFSDVNLGCKLRVSSGLDWVFSQVEEAIILEDDCLPHSDFFDFCELMLTRYSQDERVMAICGANVFGEWKKDQQSYHFSYHGGVWGWASWRRAWNLYDVNMDLWSNGEAKARFFDNLPLNQHEKWGKILEEVVAGRIDTWDYQWFFARCIQSGLTIVSSSNVITNIGFGEEATHTFSNDSPFSRVPLGSVRIPIVKPACVVVDRDYDNRIFQIENGQVENSQTIKEVNLRRRIINKAKRILLHS